MEGLGARVDDAIAKPEGLVGLTAGSRGLAGEAALAGLRSLVLGSSIGDVSRALNPEEFSRGFSSEIPVLAAVSAPSPGIIGKRGGERCL